MFSSQALVHVKALQDHCVAKEGVVTRVRKHNTNLTNEQGQYKDAVRMQNQELKEVREKLTEANRQNEKLKEEVTDLGQRVQMARTDAIRDFKASQSFIDSCAEYYGNGFDDCLKQVASAFPELDLSGITMDDGDDGSLEPSLAPENDGVVVLAQPAANPPPASNTPVAIVDVENEKANGTPADTSAP